MSDKNDRHAFSNQLHAVAPTLTLLRASPLSSSLRASKRRGNPVRADYSGVMNCRVAALLAMTGC